MDPKYTENLIDPSNPDGRQKLKKYMLRFGALILAVVVVLILDLIDVIPDIVTTVIILPIAVIMLVYYLKLHGRDILD